MEPPTQNPTDNPAVYVLGVSRGFGFLEFKSVSDAQDWMEHHRVGIHVVFF